MSTRTAGWLWVAGQFTALGVLLFLPWRTPNPLLLSIGAVVALGGGFLGLATSRALGDAFTPSPVPIAGSGLRTTGVYSVIRHPMYAAVLLIVIGVLIAAGSIWGWAWGGRHCGVLSAQVAMGGLTAPARVRRLVGGVGRGHRRAGAAHRAARARRDALTVAPC